MATISDALTMTVDEAATHIAVWQVIAVWWFGSFASGFIQAMLRDARGRDA